MSPQAHPALLNATVVQSQVPSPLSRPSGCPPPQPEGGASLLPSYPELHNRIACSWCFSSLSAGSGDRARITCRALKNSTAPSSNSSSLVRRKGTSGDMVCGGLVDFSYAPQPHSPTGDSGCSPMEIPTQTGLVTQKKPASFRFPRRSPFLLVKVSAFSSASL